MSQNFYPRPEDPLKDIIGDIIEKKTDGTAAGTVVKVIRDIDRVSKQIIKT